MSSDDFGAREYGMKTVKGTKYRNRKYENRKQTNTVIDFLPKFSRIFHNFLPCS